MAVRVALGGGGVRGVAHVVVLEAIDELGLKIDKVCGSSIGAVIGALYIGGMSGREIRRFLLSISARRRSLIGRLIGGHAISLVGVTGRRRPGWSLLDCEALLREFLPAGLPSRIEAFDGRFSAVATEMVAEKSVEFVEGELLRSLAASAAIPGLMRPVRIGKSVYIDGAVLDPVPVSGLRGEAPIIAVDLSASAINGELDPLPHAVSVAMHSVQMLTRFVVAQRLAEAKPAVLLRPSVGKWRSTEFHRAHEILDELAPFKDEAKRAIELAMKTGADA
jgi:NTE family protein